MCTAGDGKHFFNEELRGLHLITALRDARTLTGVSHHLVRSPVISELVGHREAIDA